MNGVHITIESKSLFCLQSVPINALTQINFMLLFLDPHGIEFNHDVLTPILSKYHQLDILVSIIFGKLRTLSVLSQLPVMMQL